MHQEYNCNSHEYLKVAAERCYADKAARKAKRDRASVNHMKTSKFQDKSARVVHNSGTCQDGSPSAVEEKRHHERTHNSHGHGVVGDYTCGHAHFNFANRTPPPSHHVGCAESTCAIAPLAKGSPQPAGAMGRSTRPRQALAARMRRASPQRRSTRNTYPRTLRAPTVAQVMLCLTWSCRRGPWRSASRSCWAQNPHQHR